MDLKDLKDHGQKGFISQNFINLLIENETLDYPKDKLDPFDSWSTTPKEDLVPIILIFDLDIEEGIGEPIIIIYTYQSEIRVTELVSDAHGCQYINKII